MATSAVPVGFRFHPTEEELIDHYLKNKIQGRDFDHVIPEVDICSCEPRDLPGFSPIRSDDDEWYYFSRPDYKTKGNSRNRATERGFWKITGVEREIKARRGSKALIGKKRTLTFYTGKVRSGQKTGWVIHEYYIPEALLPNAARQRDFVLCRLKKKDESTDNGACGEGEVCEPSTNDAFDFQHLMENFGRPSTAEDWQITLQEDARPEEIFATIFTSHGSPQSPDYLVRDSFLHENDGSDDDLDLLSAFRDENLEEGDYSLKDRKRAALLNHSREPTSTLRKVYEESIHQQGLSIRDTDAFLLNYLLQKNPSSVKVAEDLPRNIGRVRSVNMEESEYEPKYVLQAGSSSDTLSGALVTYKSSLNETGGRRGEYDVFLSFRCEDTRKAFTENLYNALDEEGIITFRVDLELQKGEAVAPALFAAIDESRCAIVVLSQNYASSTWCLEELVKILECMKASGRRVLPIFYDVDPSDVRKQTGSFREAFASHEERFRDDLEKVQRWRSALTEVASFSGWDSRDWCERDLIRHIVKDILNKLQLPSALGYAENLVGMDSRLRPVFLHLGLGVDDVRFIGIWGMGGIGKTTMVRAVYERISSEFECSFLLTGIRDSVERGGLLNLQKQLLSGIIRREKAEHICDVHEGATIIRRLFGHKKVLLILDDVNRSNHLEYLAGNPEWFGSGSRVLITTRNEHLLIQHGVERRLKVKELNDDDSLQLFSWKAFKKGYPEEDFLGLSESVIQYAKGLPLALEVLASLYGRDLSAWESALSQLGRVCNSDIFDVLKISYDDLDSDGKKIFLDIACFFNGENKVRMTEILNSCDVSATIGIEVLLERSLLSHSNGRLWMHDLLIETGRQIVRLESPNELGKRSRLWLSEDVKHVLTQNTGTEAIEGIFLDSTESGVEVDMDPKSFSMMRKLRYLKIKNVNLPKGLEYLPNSLRIFDWKRYPSKSLPPDFNPQKLFELRLSHSSIKHVRIGTEPLYNLKTIDLSHSLNLVSTPNLKYMPYLEVLLLEGCITLYELDPGIEVLERLSLLNLKDCKNLVHFAGSVSGLKSLKVLNLSGCSKLKELPNDMGTLESLEELHVNGTGLKELPSSIGMLERLHLLEMEDCKDLVSLPVSVRGLKSLKIVNVSGCSKLEKFPKDLGHMVCLEKFDACGTSIRELPCSIGILEGLVSMSLRDCKNLVCLPSSVGGLKSLKYLDLSGCLKLEKLPDELGHVACLEKFDACGTSIRELPCSIGILEGLVSMSLRDCKNLVCLPSSVGGLKSLKYLDLSGCLKLEKLPDEFYHIASLKKLNLSGSGLNVPSSDGHLKNLKVLSRAGCKGKSLQSWNMMFKNLVRLLSSVGDLKSLNELSLSGCSKLEKLLDELCHVACLEKLDVSGSDMRIDWRNLSDPPNPPTSLQSWNMMFKNLVRLLSSVGDLKSLNELSLSGCSKLEKLLDELCHVACLEKLDVSGSDMRIDWRNLSDPPNPPNPPTRLARFIIAQQINRPKISPLPRCNDLMEIGDLLRGVRRLLDSRPEQRLELVTCSAPQPLTHHRRGKEAEPVSSELYSPIEKLQEENEIDTRNVEESVVIEEDKSSPEHLQGLFLYCSLFPDDFEFRKHELVQLWIAEGLDMKETELETMEDAGIKHFNALESRGFFLQSKHDFQMDFDSVFSVPLYCPSSSFYKVNPVELSLLENRSSTEYFKGVDGKLDGASASTTKHLSLIYEDIDEMIFGVLPKFENLRTLLLLSGHGSSIKRVPAGLFLSLHLLTTLNLSRTLISGLPSSIGDVQPLRYIDVSYTLITRLPESIGSLNKLQTLKLRCCKDLFDLPRSMHRLTALRHLVFDIIRQLDYMPAHLGSLSNLQSLSAFLVGRDDGRRIQELKNLNDLGGALRIFRLENVSSKADAEDVDLKCKKRLQRLDLRWTKLMGENSKMQDDILESLQPPQGLKELQILFFSGTKLPSWLSNTSITDLVLITLYKCANCELLPSLGRLPKLKFLSIVEMDKVIEIDETFFRSSDHTESFKAFPELEILEIDIMLNLKEWKEVKEGDLESLIKLTMESCPELVTVPSLSCLKNLKYIEFNHCPKLVSFDCNALPTLLESLIIRDCPELKEWFQEEGHQDLGKLKSCS